MVFDNFFITFLQNDCKRFFKTIYHARLNPTIHPMTRLVEHFYKYIECKSALSAV